MQQMLNKKRIEAAVTNGWWERFQSHHPPIKTVVQFHYQSLVVKQVIGGVERVRILTCFKSS